MRAERLTGVVADHGEGPFWDAAGGRLLMVDMLRGDVLALSETSGVERHHVGTVAAAIRARSGGGFVVAVEDGFVLLDEGFAPQGSPVTAFTDPSVRMNDGGCDPQGRFLCGTMAYDAEPGRGDLFRLAPDGSVDIALHGTTISNGLEWSADGTRAFFSDTGVGRVDVFDLGPDGAFVDRRPFAAFDDVPGGPDGLALDEEGGVWVAMWGGSAIRHYDADGALVDVVELPVRNVTACAFGGADRSRLHITTSRHGLDDPEPEAGSVFVVEAGVRGAVPRLFAG
jgi:sugar lactone lactonase YvrE